MRASAFVGRVGGLAVALGIGVAVSISGGATAWALPAEVSSPGDDSVTATSNAGESPRPSVQSRGGRSQAGYQPL